MPSDLYSELKPDLVAITNPLFDFCEHSVKKRGSFLPLGAALKADGQVDLIAGEGKNGSDLTNSTEVLPVVHGALRLVASKDGCKAVAVAEHVTVTFEGQRPTESIKILLEHRRGLNVAMYLPFRKKWFGGYAFGPPRTVDAKPEIKAWVNA